MLGLTRHQEDVAGDVLPTAQDQELAQGKGWGLCMAAKL